VSIVIRTSPTAHRATTLPPDGRPGPAGRARAEPQPPSAVTSAAAAAQPQQALTKDNPAAVAGNDLASRL
jgi:hypothetical protein